MKRSTLLLLLPLLVVLALALALLDSCGEPKRTAWQIELEDYVQQGWAQHPDAYTALVGSPRTPDPAGHLHYAWVTDLPESLNDAGPLLLDMLTNPTYDADARADALEVLAHVSPKTDTTLQELLLSGSRAASGVDPATRRLLARALASLSRLRVDPQLVIAALEESVALTDRDLARQHVATVSHLGRQAETAEEKDALVTSLRTLQGLPDLVDLTYLVQRVVLLGGPAATQWFLLHVNEQQNPEVNTWGVDLAGRLDYTDDLGLYLIAGMQGSTPAFFPDAVSRRQAVNAFRDLVARYATGDPMDRKVLGRIYARLQDVEEADFASEERLALTFQDLTQELDDALGE